MNPEVFAELAAKAQTGDRNAMITLLRLAHTPVFFQCRKLLRDDRAAEDMTRGILSAIPKTLSTLKNPADFEQWICRVTASRCMLALTQQPPEEPNETAPSRSLLPRTWTKPRPHSWSSSWWMNCPGNPGSVCCSTAAQD